MPGQDVASVARAWLDAFNVADWGRVKAGLAPDSVYDEFGTQRHIVGDQAILEVFQTWKAAMPDVKAHVKHVLAEDNAAVIELTWEGTHTGPLPTPNGVIPASGKHQVTPGAMAVDVKDGKIQSCRNYFDMLTFLQQIGAAPA